MADMKLEQDKQLFAEWRAQRKHRESIPEDLWQRASSHIPELGISRVASEFHLNADRLRMKALHAGITLPKRKSAAPKKEVFQEIPLNSMFALPISCAGLIIERPDGMRVRIEGQLPDPEYVGKLAACLMAR
jgi:hypothetical protein